MTSSESPEDLPPTAADQPGAPEPDSTGAADAPPPAAAEPVKVTATDAPVEVSEPVTSAPPSEPAPASEAEAAPADGDETAAVPAGSMPPPPPGGVKGAGPKPETGKMVDVVVSSVTPDELTATLLDGRPAVLPKANWGLQPVEDLTTVISVNDRIEAAIVSSDDPQGRVVLSRAWPLKRKAWAAAQASLDANETVRATVTSTSNKGAVVDANGLRGFVPASHLTLDSADDYGQFADQVLELRVIEVDQAKERLVLSRRSLLMREQRKELQEKLASFSKGQELTGTVASLSDYGAFVDLGGVKGLVHLSELSWQRVAHPRDVLKVGDEVKVKVLDVKVKKRRISLSIRQLTGDPLSQIEVGSIVHAPVSRLVDFGAFVDLGGVEGLVHLSELAEYRVSKPGEIVTPGETVMVKILSVDRKRRRVELSIRRAISDQYGT